MIENIPITACPRWLQLNDTVDRKTGKYSLEPLLKNPFDDCDTEFLDEATAAVAKHARAEDKFATERDTTWRYENLTLEGVWKHVRQTSPHGFSHPMGYVLGMDSGNAMYSQARSDTWGTPLGLQNVPSMCLQATIEHLRSGQEDEIWNELAPIRELDENHPNTFFWTTNFYEPEMALETTARGPANVVEAQMRTGIGKLNYYKIKGQVFLNFYRSEMGTAHFHHVLITMARGFVLAGQYAAAVQLARADQAYEDIIRAEGGFLPTIDAYWDHVAEFWACMQKPHHNRLYAMRTMFENKLLQQGAQGDPGAYQWLITRASYDCLSKFDEHSLKHEIMSERGLDFLQSKVASKIRVGEDSIFVMQPFVLPRRVLVQPFGQPVEIAEHFELFNEAGFGRDRFIFTMDRGITHIKFVDAIKNLIIFDRDGRRRNVTPGVNAELCRMIQEERIAPPPPPEGTEHWSIFPVVPDGAPNTYRYEAPYNNGSFADNFTAPAFIGTQDVQIIGIQIHQRYFTENAYYLLPGKVVERVQKSGEAIIADHAPEFIHEVTAEAQMGAAVINPQNIVKAPNVVVTHYSGGCGSKAITDFDAYDPVAESYNGDIIYIPVPGPGAYTIADVPRNINLHGNLDHLSRYYAPSENVNDNYYPGCQFVNAITKWRQRRTGDPTKRYYERDNRKIPYPVAFVSRRMTYFLEGQDARGDGNQKPSFLRPGNGFWGLEATYATAARDRIGKTFPSNPERGASVQFVSG